MIYRQLICKPLPMHEGCNDCEHLLCNGSDRRCALKISEREAEKRGWFCYQHVGVIERAYTLAEVAFMCSMDRITLAKKLKSGEMDIPFAKVGTHFAFNRLKFNRWFMHELKRRADMP